MRGFTIVIALVCIAVPTLAFAKPRLAVMPIKNDDQAAEAIADALSDSASVIPTAKVNEAREKLGLPEGFLERPDLVKLQTKLRASVVVQGKVKKDGASRTLVGTISVRGKKDHSFTVEFKKTGSEKFKKGVRDELANRIAGAEEIKDEPEKKEKKEEKAEKKPEKKVAEKPDEEGSKKMLKRKKKEEPKKADPPPKKAPEKKEEAVEEPKKKKKKVATSEESDPPKKKKKKKKTASTEEITEVGETTDTTPRNALLTPAARADLGMSGGVRQLTYEGAMAGGPPRLGTGAPGARFQGELYPFAFSDPRSPAAGIGLTVEYDKTVNLSILAPGTNTSVGVDQGRWAVGARVRFNVSPDVTLAVGADYAGRHYTIERGMTVLDAPNVDYSSVNPGVFLRAAASPAVTLYARAGGMLILNTGPIQGNDEYGKATVLGFGGDAGIDVALGTKFALRIGGEYNQINFDFKGTGANSRGVTAATDRQFGAVATLGVIY